MHGGLATGTRNPWISLTNPISASHQFNGDMATMTLGGKFLGYCVVVEITELGFRLMVSGYQWFPNEFEVEFRNAGGKFPVRLIGSNGDFASVEISTQTGLSHTVV